MFNLFIKTAGILLVTFFSIYAAERPNKRRRIENEAALTKNENDHNDFNLLILQHIINSKIKLELSRLKNIAENTSITSAQLEECVADCKFLKRHSFEASLITLNGKQIDCWLNPTADQVTELNQIEQVCIWRQKYLSKENCAKIM